MPATPQRTSAHGNEEVVVAPTEAAKKRAAAAKTYIENMYKINNQHVRDRRDR